MKILTICFMFFLTQLAVGQSKWSFHSSIEFDRYTTYKGTINNKYPITMYLEESSESCGKYPSRWTPHKVYGWYMYDKIGKKIPLIGNVCYADACESYLKLFVPENLFDYLFDENFNLVDAKEVFIQKKGWSSNKMEWSMKSGSKLPVFIEVEHSFSWTTKAKLILEINNVKLEDIDLSKLANNEYIEDVDILAQKRVGDNFYVIFNYSHQSNPGSHGHGMCGAGYEEFIGYMIVNKRFEVENFESIQIHSCINSFEKEVIFNAEYPENGIKEKN